MILYEASSGVRPLEGENAAQLVMRLLSSGIMPIEQLVPDLPPELAALIGRMLARDVARRPANLREVYALLCHLAGEDSVPFGPPARVEPDDANPVFARARLDAPVRTDVDAFAPTLEPAGSDAPIVLRAGLTLPTRTAQLVPDALIALETQALALPAANAALPALRLSWARPLLLAALGMAALVSAVLVLGTRSEDPTRAVVAAPARSAPPANNAPPLVVSSLPLEATASSEPSVRETAHPTPTTKTTKTSASRDRRRQGHAARRPRSVAPSPVTAPGSQHAGAPAHGGATSTAAPSSTPPRPRPRGAECESSSECESRLCVAYACQ